MRIKENTSRILVLVVAQSSLSSAFSPSSKSFTTSKLPSHVILSLTATRRQTSSTTRRFLSQWDDEDDDVTTKPSSFDQAGQNLRDEEDEEKLNAAGDFDANPSYNTDTVDQIRAAIKKRADALGIEESKEQIEYRKKAEERALEAREKFIANGGGTDQMQQLLDLSQISNDAPKGKTEEGLPTMFYEPEKEMTEKEMAEADPVGELSILQQGLETLKKADFPSFWSATVEVFTLVFSIAATASLFIGYDYAIRNFYEWTNILPTEEEREQAVEARLRRLDMKQSNEKDLMESLKNFEQDVPSDL